MAGDSILVGPGTYFQTRLEINKDSLVIAGEFGPAETVIHALGFSALNINWAHHIEVRDLTLEAGADALLAEFSSYILIEGNVLRHGNEGGILLWQSSGVVIRNNLVYSNGDGIYCADISTHIDIYGNTISHNVGGTGITYGGSRYCRIKNNIISYNHVGVSAISAEFSCNDVYGNDINYDLGLLPDPTGSNGNISVAPLFCGSDPQDSGNYYLQSISPCAPGQHPDGFPCGLIGRYPIGCGDTAVRKTNWGRIKALFQER
jgi:parallel beta-helix repeat protein